jgi:hypothetical protein
LIENDQFCVRCRGPAPSYEDPSYLDWEAGDDKGLTVVCPGCLTVAEVAAMDDDMFETTERLSRCVRCGRERPDFDSYPVTSKSYGDPETHGWYVVDDGIVCAACASPLEMERAAGQLRRFGDDTERSKG